MWRDRQKRRVFRGMSRAVWSPSGGGFGATFERDDMTRQEEQEWADGLGPTDATRRGVIYDLLRHATGDKMSDADRAICERQLDRLMSHGVVSQKKRPGSFRASRAVLPSSTCGQDRATRGTL